MNRILFALRVLLGREPVPPAAPPARPKPWEDPNRSPAERQMWLDAQPKSLQKGGR